MTKNTTTTLVMLTLSAVACGEGPMTTDTPDTLCVDPTGPYFEPCPEDETLCFNTRYDAPQVCTDGDAGPDVVPLDMQLSGDAGPMPTLDAGPTPNDAGIDLGPEETDGGPPDEEDMGTTEPNCGSGVYDAVADKCYLRLSWTGGDFCPGFEPLRWETVEDQRRIAALVAPLGPGGTGLAKNASLGWVFVTEPRTGPTSIDWAAGHPASNIYTYMSPSATDGLSSYHRGYSWQFCMRDPS